MAIWRVYAVACAFQDKKKWKKLLVSRVKQDKNGWNALVKLLEVDSSYVTFRSCNCCWWHANLSWAEIPICTSSFIFSPWIEKRTSLSTANTVIGFGSSQVYGNSRNIWFLLFFKCIFAAYFSEYKSDGYPSLCLVLGRFSIKIC